jgi:2',3'-cyclic-nucleotide 2'-phosphodiesterase (5'-nucleotidase family)
MRAFIVLLSLLTMPALAAPHGAEAYVVLMGDQHSAYERTAQFVALVDRLKTEHPALPLAVLLNGDTLEHGNVVARRTQGEIDFAMFTAVAKRAPTILNLGNHEPEFYHTAETVQRVEATGVRVVSNLVNRATQMPFAPASTTLTLGEVEAVVIGVTTDNLNTYRVAVRPELDLANPVVWAKENFPKLLKVDAALRAGLPHEDQTARPEVELHPTLQVKANSVNIVLSHAGVKADREMLPLVPDGTLFAGAHDHLRFVHPLGRSVYVHSGSWNEYASVAWLCRLDDGSLLWQVEQVKIETTDPRDEELADVIRDVREETLTTEDKALVGQTKQAMGTADAAKFVARVVRETARVDAAFVGNTTFGAGLPGGDVSQAEFDDCVRFDGSIYVATVDGARLTQLLAAANQGPETPFEQRRGEFSFADGPTEIDAKKRYRIATTDWGAKNTARYFGEPAISWSERADLNLKAVVRARLTRDRVTSFPEVSDEVEVPSAEALFALGQQLFDAFAPEEIKAEYEFPAKKDWDEFAARLQAALESNDLSRLAAYEPEARAALIALRAIPEYNDYANWLAERLDYIEAAKKSLERRPTRPAVVKTTPPPVAPPTPPKSSSSSSEQPTPPVAPVVRPTEPSAVQIPNYAVWLERMRTRRVPASAEKLLPRVQEVFVSEGVPAELAWMAEAESTFNPAARSPVGAKGLFQLMPETAKSLGLQTFLPDERAHPEKSARAAAQYLKKLHGRFGSWPLALAAYNGGQGRVSRTLAKAKAKTFEEIADALPTETRMYVPKVLATIQVRAGVEPHQIAAPKSG